MIDQLDNQTQTIALDTPKRKRGRPVTGKAMTPAEKQKAYRDRLKKKEYEIAGKAIAGEKTFERMMEANQKLIKAEADILILKELVEIERTRAIRYMDENQGLREQLKLAEEERNKAFSQSERISNSVKEAHEEIARLRKGNVTDQG